MNILLEIKTANYIHEISLFNIFKDKNKLMKYIIYFSRKKSVVYKYACLKMGNKLQSIAKKSYGCSLLFELCNCTYQIFYKIEILESNCFSICIFISCQNLPEYLYNIHHIENRKMKKYGSRSNCFFYPQFFLFMFHVSVFFQLPNLSNCSTLHKIPDILQTIEQCF